MAYDNSSYIVYRQAAAAAAARGSQRQAPATAGAEPSAGFADFSQFQEPPPPELARARQGAFEVYKKPGRCDGWSADVDIAICLFPEANKLNERMGLVFFLHHTILGISASSDFWVTVTSIINA